MSVFIGYPSFMAYQMMKGKKGNNDDFPSISGMIARYSALGLTNEQMAANPVWVDKTGNGHDLQMKNFIWGGMSGVGGYNQNFNNWGYGNLIDVTQTHTSSKMNLNIPSTVKNTNIYSNATSVGKEGDIYDFTLKVMGLKDGARLIITKGVSSGEIERIEKDGIYKIYQPFEAGWDQPRIYIFISNSTSSDLNITIEQLPFYPDSIVFDGVDDYGICENFPILTKEKGYTVVALRQWDQDFLNTTLTGGLLSTRNYSTGEGVAFEKIESSNKGYWNLGAGGIIDFAKSPFTWQTSKQYNNVGILKGDKNHGKPLCVGCGLSGGQQCGGFAIWELVFLDHDATEEELTKIKDYFVKTYPWLFPDQAWTVVGKTNEDEDRATIANITGNGNDLVLSNFGFAEDSGYGLYEDDFFKWLIHENRVVATKTSKLFNITSIKTSIKEAVLQLYYQSTGGETVRTIPSYTIKVTGLTDGQKILYKNHQTDLVSLSSDGIHKLPSFEFLGAGSYYGFAFTKVQESCDITIEQIPEYEGYLVTDGVDDKIISSNFKFGENYTVVGEWKFLQEASNVSAGFVKNSNYWILYNYKDGINAYIKADAQGSLISGVRSIKASTSKGDIYPDFNSYVKIEPGKRIESQYALNIAVNSSIFTKLAFKNLAIYSEVLSKEDCIKAYNHLQTLKAK